ncbi:hypothetical protein L0337_06940 [candidate division KSB1 bacterium]|nr:hypothetical protein [candidate division KSB1 bacterium]
MTNDSKQTLALETYVKRSFNYYTNMVDASGVPYFNIFWIDPAEAAHDWPDSGDVTARQLQAVIMARRMTGVELPIEKVWHQNILSCFDPQTGLIIRPHTPYADGDENVSFIGDQALTLYALVTAYLDRTVRNHLTESQVGDASWLRSDASKSDTEQFTWRDIDKRMAGGYAGWSSPNHILAACETLPWGGPELREKIRAFQNCCGGSGTHAFFIAWKNAARYDNGCLAVNLHLDKLLPQAEIRGYQPYRGLLTIQLKASCNVKVRIPEFVKAEEMKVEPNMASAKTWGNFLDLDHRQAGEMIRITYPLPVYQEEISVGNPGFRQYHYRVTWKGDTVVKMEPLGNDYETGYSDFDKKDVACFYGRTGPGELYQRELMLADAMAELSDIHLDDGTLDFWYIQ